MGLSETVNVGIYSDTINVLHVKLCMMILLIELYLFTTLSDLDHISRSQQCRTVLTENFVFLSKQVETS